MRTERVGTAAAGRSTVAAGAIVAGLALALAATPDSAAAQLATRCSGEVATPELVSACAAAVTSLEGVRDGLGVGHAGAATLPGTSSALGRRFGVTPRFAITARAGLVRFDRVSPEGWSTSGRSSGWSPVLGLSAGLGVFDGFSLAPTVSGVLGVDLVGDVSSVRLPADDGFEEPSEAWGYGVRIGILRESFTLPGASLTVVRRSGASFSATGDEGSLDADVTTTSIRAVVGKDLLGLSLHGGAGWDASSADGILEVAPAGSGPVSVEFADEDDTRFVVFGGIARTFLVTSLGLDVGWSDRIAVASLSVRLTI